MAIYELRVSEWFPMIQSVESPQKGASASNTFLMTQSAKVSPIYLSVTQHFGMFQSISVRRSIVNVEVAQTLSLSQSGAKGSLQELTQFFFMYHEARPVKWDPVKQTITFTQDAVAERAKGVYQEFDLSSSAAFAVTRTRTVTQTFVMTQSAIALKGHYTFSTLGEIPLLDVDHITLTFGSKVLTLRNPDFGDARVLEITRINTKTRSGDLIIYNDPNWPESDVLRFSFSYLSEQQIYQLKDFIELSLGQLITLTDYEGVDHTGIIRTPELNIQQQGRFNYSVEFELECIDE